MRDDVFTNALGRGRGERHEGNFWKTLPQLRDLPVFRTKIVTPFADAVRFINGDELHIPILQIGEKTGEHQTFGRDIEQAIFALMQTAQAFPRFLSVERGVQKRGSDAASLQGIYLIFHQRNQRRDDNRETVFGERGELKAK